MRLDLRQELIKGAIEQETKIVNDVLAHTENISADTRKVSLNSSLLQGSYIAP